MQAPKPLSVQTEQSQHGSTIMTVKFPAEEIKDYCRRHHPATIWVTDGNGSEYPISTGTIQDFLGLGLDFERDSAGALV